MQIDSLNLGYSISANRRLIKSLQTIVVSLFLCIIFCSPLINILLQPSAQTRVDILNYSAYIIAFITPFILALVFRWDNKMLAVILICLVAFLLRFLSYAVNSQNVSFLRVFLEPALFLVGYCIASSIYGPRLIKVLSSTALISTILALFLGYYVWTKDLLRYRKYAGTNLSASLQGDILVSTEMSNIVAQIMLLILGLIFFHKVSGRLLKATMFLVGVTLGLIILYLFSVGTLLAFLLMILFLFRRHVIKSLVLIIVVFLLFLAVLSEIPHQDLFTNILVAKDYAIEWRLWAYDKLVTVFLSSPICGVDLQQVIMLIGDYPHQNVLGTLAQGGLILGVYYWIYLFIAIISFWVFEAKPLRRDVGVLAHIATWSLFYWHFKGLVQDTWSAYEVFFWSGITCYFLLHLADFTRVEGSRRFVAHSYKGS